MILEIETLFVEDMRGKDLVASVYFKSYSRCEFFEKFTVGMALTLQSFLFIDEFKSFELTF